MKQNYDWTESEKRDMRKVKEEILGEKEREIMKLGGSGRKIT